MENKTGGQAFPSANLVPPSNDDTTPYTVIRNSGMTLWDYYAAHVVSAMTGVELPDESPATKAKFIDIAVELSCAMADAMIAEHNKRMKEEPK